MEAHLNRSINFYRAAGAMLQGYQDNHNDSAIVPQHSAMPVPYDNGVGTALQSIGQTPLLAGHLGDDYVQSAVVNGVVGALAIGVTASIVTISGPVLLGLGLIGSGFAGVIVNDYKYCWRTSLRKNKNHPTPEKPEVQKPNIEKPFSDPSLHYSADPTVVVGPQTKLNAIPVPAQPVKSETIDDFGWGSELDKAHEESKLAAIHTKKLSDDVFADKSEVINPTQTNAEKLATKLLNGGNPPTPVMYDGQWVMEWKVDRMVESYPGMTVQMWTNAFSNIASSIPKSYVWDVDGKRLIKK